MHMYKWWWRVGGGVFTGKAGGPVISMFCPPYDFCMTYDPIWPLHDHYQIEADNELSQLTYFGDRLSYFV